METQPTNISARLRQFLVGGGLTLAAAATLWGMLEVYTPAASRTCGTLYRAARTAADSAQVDATVPRGETAHSLEPRSCGSIRHSARWQ